MELQDIGVLLALLLGVAGLLVGVTSFLKQRKMEANQRKMEARLSEKERLGELAGRIMEITQNNDKLIAQIRDLSAHENDEKNALLIAQDVITRAFDSRVKRIVVESHIRACGLELTPEGDSEFRSSPLNSLEESSIFDTLVNYGGMIISSKVKGSQRSYSFLGLTNVLNPSLKAPNRLREFELLIEEFSPSLFQDFCGTLRNIITMLAKNVLKSKELEVIPDNFDTTKDIALWLYHGILGYENLNLHLNKLEEVNDELKELREKLVMMKYS